MSMSEKARGLRQLFDRLTCYKVMVWGASSDMPDLDHDRVAADIDDAHVVSSLHKQPPTSENCHALVIDIDHPSWLVESTTPGHFHLYVDVPGGIEHGKYMALLRSLSAAGVIEPGYAGASQTRGHSDVRLPWIKKPATAGAVA